MSKKSEELAKQQITNLQAWIRDIPIDVKITNFKDKSQLKSLLPHFDKIEKYIKKKWTNNNTVSTYLTILLKIARITDSDKYDKLNEITKEYKGKAIHELGKQQTKKK